MTVEALDQASILLVDDMEENLVALEAVLGSLQQPLVRARSGEEAMKALLRQEFAVVLLDVLMPGMDGFETASNIKRLDQTKDVPIIFLTGNDDDSGYAFRGYATGAADYLTKPFDPWVLRAKVNVFLDLHRKNRQLAEQARQLQALLDQDRADRDRDRDRGHDRGHDRDSGRLGEVIRRLAVVEQLLRSSAEPGTARLAEQIALLGTSVDRLRGERRSPAATGISGAQVG